MGEWAAQGALGNSRIMIALTDAFEAQWRTLVERAVADMRDFTVATGISRRKLLGIARRRLLEALPTLRKKSRVEKPENGYTARVLSGDSLRRVEALVPYLDLQFRQFELGVGQPKVRSKIGAFFGEVSGQTIAGLLVLAIAAAVVTIWSI
jgi:hypothetical protein